MTGPTDLEWSVVIPTVGRPSLSRLLRSLRDQEHHPADVFVVDDRPGPPHDLDLAAHPKARVLHSGGRGPAAARNLGRRHARTDWVVVLDDDVVLPPGWSRDLLADLEEADPDVGALAGRITVPLPPGRRPTDWERTTAGLETAWWATADMALRHAALTSIGGFDERFPRAYREDADLAARLSAAGWQLRIGRRRIVHPVRPAGLWTSLRTQRGNADDALMRAVHGPRWRTRTRCPRGRLPWHLATVASAATGLVALAAGRRRIAGTALGTAVLLTGDFARRRITPGPRTAREMAAMAVTSLLIPPAAVYWRAVGSWRHRGATAWPPPVRAVLLDRDGTLVHDVPYNGDPERVRPLEGAAAALQRLREAGLRLALVSNQSGIRLGRFTRQDADRVVARVEHLLGPFDHRELCPHTADDDCACRKPRPGMILAAARALGVRPEECVMIGDIGADVDAARAAGAWSVLVPTDATRPEEIAAADVMVGSLAEAVDVVLAGRLHAAAGASERARVGR